MDRNKLKMNPKKYNLSTVLDTALEGNLPGGKEIKFLLSLTNGVHLKAKRNRFWLHPIMSIRISLFQHILQE